MNSPHGCTSVSHLSKELSLTALFTIKYSHAVLMIKYVYFEVLVRGFFCRTVSDSLFTFVFRAVGTNDTCTGLHLYYVARCVVFGEFFELQEFT